PPFVGKGNGTGNGSRHQGPSNTTTEPGGSHSSALAGPATEGTDRGSAGPDEGTSSVGGSKGSEGSGSSGSERSGGSDQGSGGSATPSPGTDASTQSPDGGQSADTSD